MTPSDKDVYCGKIRKLLRERIASLLSCFWSRTSARILSFSTRAARHRERRSGIAFV